MVLKPYFFIGKLNSHPSHEVGITKIHRGIQHPQVPFLGPPPSVLMALYGLKALIMALGIL